MKKTLTVNISGQVFHIDEDAYNVLNDYLQSIRQHFAKTKGGDEIFSDIEARIAEMLREKLTSNKQVITIEDISEVIKTIGDPNEFGGEEYDEQPKAGTQSHQDSLGKDCTGTLRCHAWRCLFRLGSLFPYR